MEIKKIVNPVAGENTYILSNDQAVLVIDPGSNGPAIIQAIQQLDKPVAAILLTHAHYDHIMSVDLVREAFGQPPVYISEKEASWLYTPLDNLSGQPRHDDMADVIIGPADHFFIANQVYDLSGFQFKLVETPGHSWGGVSFIFDQENCVFSGDALFRETIGRTDMPTSNYDDLIAGIRQNLFSLPSHYTVHPGHGMNTTIGHEKNANPFFR